MSIAVVTGASSGLGKVFFEKGCATYTPMLFYKMFRLIAKLLPSAIMVKFTSVESSVVKQ